MGQLATQRTVVQVSACFATAALVLIWSWFSSSSVWFQFVAVWFALSLLLGPFAPSSSTAGSCSVGVGPEIPSIDTSSGVGIGIGIGRRKNGYDPLPIRPQERILDDSDHRYADEHDEQNSSDSSCSDDDDNNKDLDEYMNYWLEHDAAADNDVDKPSSKKKQVYKPSLNKKQDSPSFPASQPSGNWTPQDSDLLKKLMLKHPHGKLRRWEVIAEAFNGKHSVELIIKMSKTLGSRDEGNGGGDGSYAQFLAKRKVSERTILSPLTQRWDGDESGMVLNEKESAESGMVLNEKESAGEAQTQCGDDRNAIHDNKEGKGRKDWTEGEDKALLNALKAFPKDIPMRWDKVALAVPGKTKQQCFRRYAELRDGFRSKQLEKGNSSVSH